MYDNLTIGVSPLTKRVFLGRLNKKGDMWLEGKRDITEMFMKCCVEYFEAGTENTITANGEPLLIITAKKPEKEKTKK